MIDPGGGGPASSGDEPPAELVGALRTVRGRPDGDQVAVRGIGHEHGVREVRPLPNELVRPSFRRRAGTRPRPAARRCGAGRRRLPAQIGGESHVRGVAFSEPAKDLAPRQEVEGTAVWTQPLMELVRRKVKIFDAASIAVVVEKATQLAQSLDPRPGRAAEPPDAPRPRPDCRRKRLRAPTVGTGLARSHPPAGWYRRPGTRSGGVGKPSWLGTEPLK